ncbi:T9SS type B sorting domain-containing protein [Flammeovirga sp. MY04]|uniref:FG-GAP-like repeat-containing protein n=1 Tax=Flammeovirga sp. MY04 TaxID=1191459 RepID=UPI0008063D6D|nr:FG-GAP-like repeat-containing protein [Flammeovirga sp. MY04]ANQ50715.1 T9SS type B sorting domain-containing protein [Flammeovirga sp. MY04]
MKLLKLFFYLLTITTLGLKQVNGQGFEEKFFPNIPLLKNSSLISVDLDNDGIQEIIISGEDASGSWVLNALKFDGSQWNNWSNGLKSVEYPKLNSFDIDKDGLFDLLVCGQDGLGNGIIKLYKNLGNGQWSDISGNLPQLSKANGLFGDFLMEGENGLLLTGLDNGVPRTTYFLYKEGDNWSEQPINLPAAYNAELIAFDADNNGTLDVFIGGNNSFGGLLSQIYLNQGNGNWMAAATSFSTLTSQNVKLVDINRDGRLDIIQNGFGSGGLSVTKLYLNLETGWTETNWQLPQIAGGDLVFTDFNGNTFQDIAITGVDNDGNKKTFILYNDGTKFIDSGIGLTEISDGKLLLTDWNDDQNLDLILTGETYVGIKTLPYQNIHNVSQLAISKPNNLQSSVTLNNALVSWDKVNTAIGYEVLLGTSSGNYDMYQGNINSNSKKNNLKPYTYSNNISFTNLLEGSYYLKVIASGSNHQVSPASSEHEFIICDKPDLGEDITICSGVDFTLSEGTSNDIVVWSTLDGKQIGQGNNLTTSFLLTTDVEVAVTKKLGCTVKDTIRINILELPLLDIEDQQVCFNTTTQLTAPGNWQKVRWFEKGESIPIEEDNWFIIIEVIGTKEYVAEITNLEGCISYDTAKVEMLALPEFSLGEDITICEGNTVSIEIENLNSYQNIEWYSNFSGKLDNDNQLTYQQDIYNNEIFWVKVVSPEGCEFLDTIKVDKLELPEFTLEGDISICENEAISFSIGDETDKVEWYLKSQGKISEGNTYTMKVTENDSLWCIRTNSLGCIWSDTIKVDKLELPEFDFPEKIEVCYNSEGTLAVEGDWKSVFWFDIQGNSLTEESSKNYSFTVVENDQVVVKVTSWQDCITFDTVDIEMIPLPTANAGEDKSICTSQSVQIGSNTEPNNTFLWFPSIGLSDQNVAQPIASPKSTTTYYLKVTDSNACVSVLDSMTVFVNEFYSVNAGEDQEICFGEGLELGGYPIVDGDENNYNFSWYPSEDIDDPYTSHPMVFPQKTTEYIVTASLGDCISYKDTIKITVRELPIISISEDIAIGYKGETTLEARGGKYYLWTPDYNIDQPNIATPTVNPEVTTTYTVRVMSEFGCSSTESVTVHVGNEIFIPNLFTPNQDGKNDIFLVYGKGVKSLSIKVTDQKGVIVYNSDDLNDIMSIGWDGKMGNIELPSGTYFWKINGTYEDGSEIRYKGNNTGTINLLR